MLVDTIFESLEWIAEEKLDDSTTTCMKRDIGEKLKAGWTASEIVSHMKNMEEINPHLDEATALGRMQKVANEVKSRLALGTD